MTWLRLWCLVWMQLVKQLYCTNCTLERFCQLYQQLVGHFLLASLHVDLNLLLLWEIGCLGFLGFICGSFCKIFAVYTSLSIIKENLTNAMCMHCSIFWKCSYWLWPTIFQSKVFTKKVIIFMELIAGFFNQ